MKLKKIEINHFKGLKHFEMDLTEYGDKPRFLTGIVGDNGAGKTTVLQAIALVLSFATRKISSINDFHWKGFIPENAISSATRIKLEIELTEDEIVATQELFERWKDIFEEEGHHFNSPNTLTNLTLLYQQGKTTCLEGADALLELRGRTYVKMLLTERLKDTREYFARVGDVFWFDQYRHLGNSVPDRMEVPWEEQKTDNFTTAFSWEKSIATLREYLNCVFNYLD
jgi:predicted ATP-dependent endonuclease of OLD family